VPFSAVVRSLLCALNKAEKRNTSHLWQQAIKAIAAQHYSCAYVALSDRIQPYFSLKALMIADKIFPASARGIVLVMLQLLFCFKSDYKLEHFFVTMRPYGELLIRLPVLYSRKRNRQ
jgi:hypothetical protein